MKEAETEEKDYETLSLDPGIFTDSTRVLTSKEQARRQRLLAALAKSSELLAIEKSIDSILEGIAQSVGRALDAKYVNFWDFTPDKKGVYIRAAYGMQQQYLEHSKRVPLLLGTAWIGRAMQTGKIWATSNVQKDPLLPSSWLPAVERQGYHGLVCTPLKIKDRIIGGMCIYYDDIHEFEPFEMTIAGIVANQAATAVENSRIFVELEAERRKTLSIVQSLNDGLIMYDLQGVIIFFNSRAEALLGLAAKEVVGICPSVSFAEGHIHRENLLSIYSRPQSDYENWEFSTDKPCRLVLLITRIPVRDELGQQIGMVQVLHDVTHEREVEQLKANFLTTASHQLRTPLAGIKWALEALHKDSAGFTPSQKALVEETAKTNQNLITLINDLLDVSRIEENKLGCILTETDLVALAKEAVSEFKEEATRLGITLDLTAPDHALSAVSVDREKMMLAVGNLIDNAIKYTPEGGTVSVTLEEKDGSLSLSVRDTGIGIAEKDQAFLFNKFFRSPNAVLKETAGSGLGLYIAKQIVEINHGTLRFASRLGEGSTFSIELPIAPTLKQA
ncbi:GAF domain-containing protein [Candidatus Kaiserbacteria bacterium]|nr:GAF domain-containing protein [Candidatus Kaiserbacteria bacterium]